MTVEFPTTAKELRDSRFLHSGRFVTTAQVLNPDPVTYDVCIEPDMPLLVHAATFREDIAQKTGVKLPTVAEFEQQKIPVDVTVKLDGLSTCRINTALWLNRWGMPPMVYMIQNHHVASSKSPHFNVPSANVSSGSFLETILLTLNLNTGVLIPAVDPKALMALHFLLPSPYPALQKNFLLATLKNAMSQENNILSEINGYHTHLPLESDRFLTIEQRSRAPKQRGKEILWEIVETLADRRGTDRVHCNILGEKFQMAAAVMQRDKSSYIFTVGVTADLNPLSQKVDFNNMFTVDPGVTPRFNTGLYTLSEALALKTSPSTREYFLRIARGPVVGNWAEIEAPATIRGSLPPSPPPPASHETPIPSFLPYHLVRNG